MDYLETEYTVHNTLICEKCHRVLIAAGEYCLFSSKSLPTISEPSLSKCIVYAVFTVCWQCCQNSTTSKESTDNIEEISEYAVSILTTVGGIFKCPIVLHTTIADIEDTQNKEPTLHTGEFNSIVHPIVPIYILLKFLRHTTKFSSIQDNSLSTAVGDFLRPGATIDIILCVFDTPFMVNNIVLCPRCKKNIIFTGYNTVVPLEKQRILANKELSLIFFAGCFECSVKDNISDEDLSIYIIPYLLGMEESLTQIKKMFPTPVKIEPFPDAGAVSILHREKLAAILLNTCIAWKLENDKGVEGYTHFIRF